MEDKIKDYYADNYIRNAGFYKKALQLQNLQKIVADKGKSYLQTEYKDDLDNLIISLSNEFSKAYKIFYDQGNSSEKAKKKAYALINPILRAKIRTFNKKHKVFLKYFNIKKKIKIRNL